MCFLSAFHDKKNMLTWDSERKKGKKARGQDRFVCLFLLGSLSAVHEGLIYKCTLCMIFLVSDPAEHTAKLRISLNFSGSRLASLHRITSLLKSARLCRNKRNRHLVMHCGFNIPFRLTNIAQTMSETGSRHSLHFFSFSFFYFSEK